MSAQLSSEAARPLTTGGNGFRRLVRGVRRNRAAMVGLVIVLLLISLAMLAPLLAPYAPDRMGAGRRLTPPSLAHLFGTDEFGRDIFSRIIYGSRLTLTIGAISVGISAVSGLLLGLLAGYAGGWLERVIMRGTDVLFSFTEVLIALAAVAMLGPTLQNAMIAVGIAAIPFYVRITYSQVLVEKNRPYFEAAVAAGAGTFRLIFRHLLPNVMPPLIVVATLGMSTAMLAAAGLSFLGLGAQPPLPEWGLMLSQGRDFITRAPWICIIPGIAIVITVLGFNLLGDGIREALDPGQQRH
ncbi:diguanylate cyclase [Erwinia typographi]|uniref:Diguanylate cyclase n=1 Tax=Erwinia typographi TaxID=371042 RepID=A0A0A4A9U5_9GAMM|nr:ABC transporter permease [Erwinia typographi]KGT94608.1 diguanylate cyclase [Erwinia typographi]